MKARCGRARGWARARRSCCACAAWELECRSPPWLARKRRQSRRRLRKWQCRAQPRQEGERMANILVCDDERSICEMLDIALRREGHKVETVNSGEAAKRKIDGALYDVVITDIKM